MRKFHKDLINDKVNTKVCNITLLAENDLCNDFYAYSNRNGNCLAVALCDIYNNDVGFNVITPSRLCTLNNRKYTHLCRVVASCADFEDTSLIDLVNNKFTGVVCICCRGGLHAIALIDGMILNNWSNRSLLSYNDFLNDIDYKRSPKVRYYISNINIHLNADILNALEDFNQK